MRKPRNLFGPEYVSSGVERTLQARPPLPALTSVRFLAALWVATFHMQAMQTFLGPAWFQRVASFGSLGVSFFFVLSGFILVYSYWERPTRTRDFWQARFARIYPALAFALLLTAPMFFYLCLKMDIPKVMPEWTWPAAHLKLSSVLTVLMLQTWIPLNSMAWHMPTWSLSNEAFFYFLFPFLLPLFGRFSRKQLLAVIIAGFALGLTVSAIYNRIQPDGPTTLVLRDHYPVPWKYALNFNPLSRIPEFLMGMASGFLFLHGKRNRRLAWPVLLTGILLLALPTLLIPPDPMKYRHAAVLAPAFALIVGGIALRPQGFGAFEHRFSVLLGDASYSFYLLHPLVIGSYMRLFRDPAGNLRHQAWPWFFLVVANICVVALLSYKFIEEPLRRRLRPKRKQETETVPQKPATLEATVS
jgi:peptidoglycan/LPS O-acetylase OafA/YrhL